MAEEEDENQEEQVIEEGFLTLEERVFRAQRKIKYAQGLEKEADGLKKKAKELLEIAAEAREESDDLILEKPNPQLEIPTTTPATSNDPEICPHPDKGPFHDWKRIRMTDGIALDDCANCGLERTARLCDTYGAPIEPSWAYSAPTTKRDEAAAETPGEPVAS